MSASADQYLRSVLKAHACDHSGALAVANREIAPVVQAWGGSALLDIRLSGSVEKGTANAGSNDLDLFIRFSSTVETTLYNLYDGLLNVAAQRWQTRAQNVSIGVQCQGYHFDLVPARLQPGYRDWHWLWRSKARTWTQTNVERHIQTVRDSGRIEEIRILKLWRTQAGLDLPSFLLELAVIEALRGRSFNTLSANVLHALEWISNRIETVRLVDPANSSNIVSADLTGSERRAVALAAQRARHAQYFSEIVA